MNHKFSGTKEDLNSIKLLNKNIFCNIIDT